MIPLPERQNLDCEQWHQSTEQSEYKLRVASPGIIQAFNATAQTVTVQIAIREKVTLKDGVISWETIPTLLDCAISIPQNQNYAFTLPIISGDECLVVFTDCCYDAWWQSGGVQNQIFRRRHDLSDGIAIIGIKSQPNVIPNYSTDSMQMRNMAGTSFLEIKGDTINIVSGTAINLTAPSINTEGSSGVVINSNGDSVTIDGKVFLAHEHTGVQSGGSDTGGVV